MDTTVARPACSRTLFGKAWVSGMAFSDTLMLLCAVLASLAMGVLVAYSLCQILFRVFRVHQQQAARVRMARAAAGSVRQQA